MLYCSLLLCLTAGFAVSFVLVSLCDYFLCLIVVNVTISAIPLNFLSEFINPLRSLVTMFKYLLYLMYSFMQISPSFLFPYELKIYINLMIHFHLYIYIYFNREVA